MQIKCYVEIGPFDFQVACNVTTAMNLDHVWFAALAD